MIFWDDLMTQQKKVPFFKKHQMFKTPKSAKNKCLNTKSAKKNARNTIQLSLSD